MKTIQEHGAYVLYPAIPPAPYTLNHNGSGLRQVASTYPSSSSSFLMESHIEQTADKVDYEFRTVLQEFCNEFENPTIRTVEDIISWNEEHRDGIWVTMAPPWLGREYLDFMIWFADHMTEIWDSGKEGEISSMYHQCTALSHRHHTSTHHLIRLQNTELSGSQNLSVTSAPFQHFILPPSLKT